jgi:hypothetical protein
MHDTGTARLSFCRKKRTDRDSTPQLTDILNNFKRLYAASTLHYFQLLAGYLPEHVQRRTDVCFIMQSNGEASLP